MTFDQETAAAIDLGSNTFRLLIARRSAEKLDVLEKQLVTVRLGHGLAENRILLKQAMDLGLEVLGNFRQIIDRFRVQNIRACGTEALRRARNGPLFLQKAEKILGHKIEIISGEEEACLSLAGALSGFKTQLPGRILLVDVGGGSTEFILTDTLSGKSLAATSSDLGVISLTEKYLDTANMHLQELDEIIAGAAINCLKKLDIPGPSTAPVIMGCGGTATSMAALDLGLSSYSESLVHGHILQSGAIEKLWGGLIRIPAAKRNELPCLDSGRGEILPAGIRIYQVLLKLTGLKKMTVSDAGLLEGILLSTLRNTTFPESSIAAVYPEN